MEDYAVTGLRQPWPSDSRMKPLKVTKESILFLKLFVSSILLHLDKALFLPLTHTHRASLNKKCLICLITLIQSR